MLVWEERRGPQGGGKVGVGVCVCDDMVSKQCIQNLFVILQIYVSSSVGVCTAKYNFVALLQDH